MNKKKLARNVSLVALSAVMAAGTATAFAGCGSSKNLGDPYIITVNIFCDETDKNTNDTICQTWAQEYNTYLHQLHAADPNQGIPDDKDIQVKFTSTSDDDGYFTQLDNDFIRDRAADIIYVRPRQVKSWAQRGRVMNLADFINAAEGEEYDANIANIQGLWPDVLAFYGYDEKAEKAGTYSTGDSLKYYKQGETLPNGKTINSKSDAGFYTTANSTKVGVYGLPKDYSNFTMGFNGRYFSDALKLAYQTIYPATERETHGAIEFPSKQTYTGKGDEGVVTYAVTGDYTVQNPFGQNIQIHAEQGKPAPLINIGVPVYYKPYNFYQFSNFNDALAGGDPVAKAVNEFTNGVGYLITLPGFPGDTFEMPATAAKDPNAPYDTNIGHITFTYAEYGALTWAVTYFCNTFNFRAIQDATDLEIDPEEEGADLPDALLNGTTGVVRMDGQTKENVYGNDQYEGSPNATLYLLPWLAGNDANFINLASDTAINAVRSDSSKNDEKLTDGEYLFEKDGQQGVHYNRLDASVPQDSKGGQITEEVPKLRLNGETEMVDVQYGVNSERFIETYGAFLAYGSDWNGNSGNAGSEEKVKQSNGWELFRHSACIFYGAGTWDNKTKNESPVTLNGETFCEWRSMTVPVSEKYALASCVKNGFYEMQGYGDANNDGSLKTAKIYTQEDIINNQVTRQDKWAARMDSVGFALNDQVRQLSEKNSEAAWKLQGAADLIMTLSADQTAQHDLTLGGAQLPNFTQQCIEFAHYQDDDLAESGSFSDMITPEGFATTNYWVEGKEGLQTNADGVKEADQIWKAYNSVIEKLNTDSDSVKGTELDTTFADWFKKNYPNNEITGYQMADGSTVPLRWDHQFDNKTLSDVLTGEYARRAAAMKVLKMVTYTYADRDMQLRMQYGMNAVRDSAMYTYQTTWIDTISMRSSKGWAYRNQGKVDSPTIKQLLAWNIKGSGNLDFYTPAFFCFNVAQNVQQYLEQSMRNEANSLNK